MDDNQAFEIDLSGLDDKIAKAVEQGFSKLEERFTPSEQAQSLTEKVSNGPVKYDYKEAVNNYLHTFKRSIRHTDYKFLNEKNPYEHDFNKIAVREYDKDRKVTEYKLTESMVETIGTVDPDCCIPEVWADQIERDHVYPGSVFLGAWFVNWYDDIKGKPGDKVHICRVGPATCADLSCEEPTTTAAAVACPYITLEHDTCAYTICREDIEDVQVGLVDALNEGLGSCLAVCVDNYFFNVALSCTNGGTVSHTAEMSGSLLLEAMGSMMAGTYTPVKVIMHPVPWISLAQDINFRYADHFGARDVVSGGRLETAYGLEINVTPKGTLVVGGGTYRTLLLAKGALGGAIKHGITVETEYSPRLQKRWVIADIRYGGVCLHPDGIYWIQTVEA